MITYNCAYCGVKVIAYESRKAKYCSKGCAYKDRMRQNDERKMKKCEWCGKEYRSKYKEQRFCSRECVNERQKTLIGELSPKYHHTELQCEVCGKTFSVKQSKVGKARFCSNKCRNDWYTEHCRQDENREYRAKKIIDTMTSGKMPRTLTNPHMQVSKALDEHNVKHINEYSVKYYSVDIYIEDSNLMIEIMGDFWHSNPTTKHCKNLSETQKNRIPKDKAKHTYILNKYGIEVLYIWESDINDDIEKCMKLIKEYINNNGHLEDYHSYNYHLANGKLVMNDEIIKPLFAA